MHELHECPYTEKKVIKALYYWVSVSGSRQSGGFPTPSASNAVRTLLSSSSCYTYWIWESVKDILWPHRRRKGREGSTCRRYEVGAGVGVLGRCIDAESVPSGHSRVFLIFGEGLHCKTQRQNIKLSQGINSMKNAFIVRYLNLMHWWAML